MKHLGELRVSDCMTEQTVVVEASDQLTSAVRLMEQNHLTVLPAVDSQKVIVGILSISDVLEVTHELQSDISSLACVTRKVRNSLVKMLIDESDKTLVSDVMSTPVETIPADTNLVVAARMLVEIGCHHLPVMSENGKVVGIISTSSYVHAVADFGALAVG